MLIVAGIDHQHAPVGLRERFAVTPDERAGVLATLRRIAGPAVLLSTCARVEVYAEVPDGGLAPVLGLLQSWFARRGGLGSAEIAPVLHTATGSAAFSHLVRVACGLASAVAGEDEILGQVRRAWLDAAAVAPLPAPLDAAFALAVASGRRVRRRGGTGWASLADAAAGRVRQWLAAGHAPHVVIAGSGPIGRRVGAALRADDTCPRPAITLAGRDATRVTPHAVAIDARPAALADLEDALTTAGAAVVALRSGHVDAGAAFLTRGDPARPLLVIDLSVPRVVPAPPQGAGICLLNIDDLGGVAGRWSAAERAEAEDMAAAAVAEFTASGRRGADDALAALRRRAEAIRRRQVTATLRRLPELDDEARNRIEALTRAIVNRVLHEPTVRLRADGSGQIARQVEELFGIGGA